MDVRAGITRAATATVVLLLLGGLAFGLLALDRPEVEDVDSDWGTVTDERTEVETRIVVDNPRLVRLVDGGADVEYTVSMNDVEVARGREERVDLSGDRNVVEVSTWVDNSEIPRWWATHVNRNETTTVRIDSDAAVDFGAVRFPAASLTRTRTVETDLLEPLRSDRTRRVRAFGETVLVVDDTDARWGEATVERTPLRAEATVTNPTSVPIPITNLTYTIAMNDVVVGTGEVGERTLVSPGSTVTIGADAAIDNSRLDEWWVTHLRRNETTELTVRFEATVEFAGARTRIPLEFLTYERTFRTDILGPGEGATNASATAGGIATGATAGAHTGRAKPDGAAGDGVDPGRVDTGRTEPGKVAPDGADPGKVGPAKAHQGRVAPDDVDPKGADPKEVDPDGVDPKGVAPDGVDPGRAAPGYRHARAGSTGE